MKFFIASGPDFEPHYLAASYILIFHAFCVEKCVCVIYIGLRHVFCLFLKDFSFHKIWPGSLA